MRRPTINDIARAAGVSEGAVSAALNGRPGVSDTTRGRILQLAGQLGRVPSSAARALSDGRGGAIGLVIDRPALGLGVETFFMRFIAGIQEEPAEGETALMLQSVEATAPELTTYKRWHAERRVDGALMVDLRRGAPRVGALPEMGLPAVVVGGPEGTGGLPCVWSDDGGSMRRAVEYLAGLGHRRIGRVAGPQDLVHTGVRTAALVQAARERGLEPPPVLHSDYSGESGARTARALLDGPAPPTALIYDNDLMAVAGLGAAQELGFSVPDGLSVVAGDDSPLCQAVRPALTAIRRDLPEYGRLAASLLLEAIASGASRRVPTSPGELVLRASTAPPPPG
ncbi:LacI family DNA-binding transcriptional regulator [Streptomonospora salina]|uniref:DNA-binding LacI/PurR family transcriptional regulator n=1 Tax=Streptomonospora salina TaxID=104205 RepID=A0A841EFG1_9ACTN|nr:LacI family DNA-binding transcriptional regulator [Streptomonospora salina]MBB6001054.1 DNA-binding LacI/PurR family transcriptional regulator [Streptomonospora salina]